MFEEPILVLEQVWQLKKKMHECNKYRKKIKAYSLSNSAYVQCASIERELYDFLKAKLCL